MKFSNAISTSLFLALPVVHAAAAARASPLARRQDDIQSSLVLDPSVICTGCAQDGQDPPVDGQVASLTSTNNFINFCLGKELTDGQQKAQGSCNAVPMGQVIPQANMPASKITFPTNGGTFAADTPFTFTMAVENMILGNFVNAQENYFGAPQQLQNGILLAHSHVVVQLLPSIDSTEIPDPTIFAFFKGLNDPDVGGVLSTDVTEGLPAGVYRFCSMNTGANHQPANVAVAQHGSLDDCIYATAVAEGEVIVEEPVEEVEDPAEEVVDPPAEEVEEPPAEEVEAPVEEVEVPEVEVPEVEAPEVEVPEVVAPAPPANNGGGRGGRGRGGRGRGRGGRGRGGRRGRGRFSRSRGGRFAL